MSKYFCAIRFFHHFNGFPINSNNLLLALICNGLTQSNAFFINPLRTELILILRFLHISNHTLISNASLHHWLQR